ncbi:MAG: cytochrome C oxidase subunit IV family protein, partial [Planctomycetia bacterium]
LMVLTGLTVSLNSLQFGEYDIVIAMFIATVKAILVGLYFMHLRYDKPLNAFFFCGSLVFAFIFMAACLLDTQQSRPTVAARDTVLIQDFVDKELLTAPAPPAAPGAAVPPTIAPAQAPVPAASPAAPKSDDKPVEAKAAAGPPKAEAKPEEAKKNCNDGVARKSLSGRESIPPAFISWPRLRRPQGGGEPVEVGVGVVEVRAGAHPAAAVAH